MERAEGVNEAGPSEILDALALLGGKAGVVGVLLGAGEVDLGMGGVEITTDHNGFGLLEMLEILEESWIPDFLA